MTLRPSRHPSLWKRTPARAGDWFDQATLDEARAYVRPLHRIAIVEGACGLAVLLAFITGKAAPDVIDATGVHGWVLQLLLVLLVMSALQLVYEPWFEAYVQLVHDRRHGLSTQTGPQFLADTVKGFVLGLVLNAAVLIPVYAFIRATSLWWLWAWLAVVVLLVVMAFVYPVVIMPRFNTFTPLPAGELRARIEHVATLAATPVEGIYTMDASRRTRRDNAFVSGFGATKRVVLFDTILEHPDWLVEQVVAHEIGHYRLKHIPKSVPVTAALLLLAFVALRLCAGWTSLLDWAGVDSLGDPASVPLLLLVFGAVTKATSLVEAWWSRSKERQADLEALELLVRPGDLVGVWRRMAPKNKAELEPSWWQRLQHSHPEVAERMAFARDWGALNAVPVDEPA
jgi:STE24 endopeptidase